MSTNFTHFAPICFLYERNTANSKEITSNLKYDFFEKTFSDKRWLAFEGLSEVRLLFSNVFSYFLTENFSLHFQLFADGVIGYGMDRLVKLLSEYTPVYHYHFSYVGRYSHTYYPEDKPYGAVHHDDLLFLFYVPVMVPQMANATDADNEIVERMTGLWTNFAKTGLVFL